MTGETITDEARRRIEAERRLAEEALLEQGRRDAEVQQEALRRVIVEHVNDAFGRSLEVLRDPHGLAALMMSAGLGTSRAEDRVNPNGTVTKVTTTIVPLLRAVDAHADVLILQFDGVVGTTLAHWTTATEVLRSGLRARSIGITEPYGGLFRLDLRN
ncbi:hypothetical protein [Tsukamurella pulmonis]|uniref:hypothetical protein n=1 Tax=Tsukamurella pulmonis TaxID=47312 RepID=UPI000E09D908|nr:hypothetical protein [Tsukamurella pulmonis]RDH13561.1 hypothetical protein DVB88_01765 [Tsukamurella pulmonis]